MPRLTAIPVAPMLVPNIGIGNCVGVDESKKRGYQIEPKQIAREEITERPDGLREQPRNERSFGSEPVARHAKPDAHRSSPTNRSRSSLLPPWPEADGHRSRNARARPAGRHRHRRLQHRQRKHRPHDHPAHHTTRSDDHPTIGRFCHPLPLMPACRDGAALFSNKWFEIRLK